MIFSTMCKAAIKAVISIAANSDESQYTTIKQISSDIDESEHTVGKLLQILSKQGIVNSVKGANGGFYMSQAQKMNPIQDVVRLIDGTAALNGCVLGLSQCNAAKPCPIHHEYLKAKKVIEEILYKKNINELADLVKSGSRNLIN